jgi:tetratricopeptide (TPR) repeat protein
MPAFIALVASSAIGFGALAATGQFRSTNLDSATLADLEKRIVDCQDGAIWIVYGDKLQASARYPDAVKAYEKALGLQPNSVEARIKIAIALGQEKNSDNFFGYFSRLSSSYPKLAVDLLERPELTSLKSDPRWEPAAAAARAQAVD